MLIPFVLSLFVAIASGYLAVHLRRDAEDVTILLLVATVIALFLSVAFAPWFVKLLLVVGLLLSGSGYSRSLRVR